MNAENDKNTKITSLEIAKKGKAWLTCKNKNGYECKLKISPKTEHLIEGNTYDMELKDVSIISKYGTDIRYELIESTIETKKIFLKCKFYNRLLVNDCKKLGGKWDCDEKLWVFSVLVEKQVEDLDFIYNSKLIPLQISANEAITQLNEAVSFIGFDIAIASGKNSGAKLCEGVFQISGCSPTSSGSVKNWNTYIYENSVFRLYVPIELYKKHSEYESKKWNITILKEE